MNETKNGTYCLPERLKVLRENRPLQKVADSLGISRASLGYYESGERKPDAEILFKIAEYYNVSCDYLLGRTEAKTTDSNIQMINSKTGLTEESIAKLIKYNEIKKVIKNVLNSGEEYNIEQLNAMHSFELELDTINILINSEVLQEIMLYIFSNYDYCILNNFGEHTPLQHISFFDSSLSIATLRGTDFLSRIHFSRIQTLLDKLRNKYCPNNKKTNHETSKEQE